MPFSTLKTIDPLPLNIPIVDEKGQPTMYFSRQWQIARNINITVEDVTVSLEDLHGLQEETQGVLLTIDAQINAINLAIANLNSAVASLESAVDAIQARILPPGGTAGQVLKKNTATNYDVVWGDDLT